MPNPPLSPKQAALAAAGGRRPLDAHGTEALRLLRAGRNVVLYGPPGTGKTFSALAVREWWLTQHGPDSVILATFHPSYSYEDFVEGFRPSIDDPSQFALEDGVLLEAASRAKGGEVLLVIDEINRGDVARIFGEIITYIERDKRNIPFRTAQRRDREREIPQGLHVIGTMNTADKSISLLDVALRRRFTFIPCPPDPGAFAAISDWAEAVDGVALADLLSAVNERLLEVGVERDRLVGHAVLAVPRDSATPEALLDRLRYDLIPLVEEYLFNDAERVAQVLPGLIRPDGAVNPSYDTAMLRQLAGRGTLAAAEAGGGYQAEGDGTEKSKAQAPSEDEHIDDGAPEGHE